MTQLPTSPVAQGLPPPPHVIETSVRCGSATVVRGRFLTDGQPGSHFVCAVRADGSIGSCHISRASDVVGALDDFTAYVRSWARKGH